MPEIDQWYFEQNGSRHGPVALETIAGFFASKMVTGDTLVWNPSFGIEWKRLSEVLPGRTEDRSANLRRLEKAKPQASSSFAWIIALVPILGSFIELILSADGALPSDGIVAFIYFVVYTILCTLDSNHIQKSGASAELPIRWFWFVPVYLYKRARILGHSLAYFWGWIAALFVGLAMTQTDWVTKDVYWGTGLPACDSGTIKNQVSALFNEVPLVVMTGGKALRMEEIKELSSSEKERTCHATILSTRTLRHPVSYKITDAGSDFYVEVEVSLPD